MWAFYPQPLYPKCSMFHYTRSLLFFPPPSSFFLKMFIFLTAIIEKRFYSETIYNNTSQKNGGKGEKELEQFLKCCTGTQGWIGHGIIFPGIGGGYFFFSLTWWWGVLHWGRGLWGVGGRGGGGDANSRQADDRRLLTCQVSPPDAE